MTRSFSLLVGLAYHHVLAVSTSSQSVGSNGTTQTSDSTADGKYFGAQLWFGMGGYF